MEIKDMICNVCNGEILNDKLAVCLQGADYEYAVCGECLVVMGREGYVRGIEESSVGERGELAELRSTEEMGR
jgi:hypothetical protein|tara:strand:- start:472 stop:690 length:219 start_codon:yes stop_codon:yes gene_type:complete